MLSPRVLIRGNPARTKFAAENKFKILTTVLRRHYNINIFFYYIWVKTWDVNIFHISHGNQLGFHMPKDKRCLWCRQGIGQGPDLTLVLLQRGLGNKAGYQGTISCGLQEATILSIGFTTTIDHSLSRIISEIYMQHMFDCFEIWQAPLQLHCRGVC